MTAILDTVTIRRATRDDAAGMAEIGAGTFVETFGHLYPPEDLQLYLSTKHTPDSWARILAEPASGVFVAENQSGRKLGFILVGACSLPVKEMESSAGEIKQLYVFAEFHNLRLGARLMEAGQRWLEAESRQPVYIGVWSENYGAQRFYGRYGYTKVGEYGFPVGNTVDHEFIFKSQ